MECIESPALSPIPGGEESITMENVIARPAPEPVTEGDSGESANKDNTSTSTAAPFSPTSAPSKLIAQTLHTASLTMGAAGSIIIAAGHNMSAAGSMVAHNSLPLMKKAGETISASLSVGGSAVMSGVASLRSRFSPKKGTPETAAGEIDVESGVLPPAPEEGGSEEKGEEGVDAVKPTTTATAPATAPSSTLQRLRTVAGSVGASIASGSANLKEGVVTLGGSLGASLASRSTNLGSSLKAGVAVTTQKTTAMWGSVVTGAKSLMKRPVASAPVASEPEAALPPFVGALEEENQN